MMRLRPGLVLFAVALAATPLGAAAQQRDTASNGRAADSTVEQVYDSRRASLMKDLQSTQDELTKLRSQRVALEAQVDNALAQATERRANELMMTSEQTALVRLDSTLSAAQDNMQEQRDRMQALGDAVKRRSGAVLVVLLRADSAQGTVGSVQITVDGAPSDTHTYSAIASQALQEGAVDQLYRSAVLPVSHTVAVTVDVAGQPVAQSIAVDSKTDVVTYVQFTVRGTQVAPSTWTSQGTTPY